jgi:hypothetical protein
MNLRKPHINRVDHTFAKPLPIPTPMKNTLRSLLAGLAASVLALAVQAADLAPAPFSVGSAKGDVTYKLAGTTTYLPLTVGTALPQGATIKTGAGSTAQIVFASGSSASIAPNSEVEVTKFEQEAFSGPLPAGAEPSMSSTQIKIVNGGVTSKVAKLKKGSEFVVSSPVGAAGVRGTTFQVTYDAATGAFSVATAEGAVVFTSASGAVTAVNGGEGFDGSTVTALTDAQIAAIEAAIVEAVADGATGNFQITIPEVDQSVVDVSPN